MLLAAGRDPAAPSILRPSDSLTNSSLDIPPARLATPFRQVLSPAPTPTATLLGLSSPRFLKLPPGSRVEVSPTSFKISRKIGELLRGTASGETADTVRSKSAGSALIVDYGGDKAYGNSFRVSPS